ncbi:MAG TPA: 5'/3'-nucleotidase SurE [Acidimicrobiales bacterium]|nr:5'/3'-nucleotidase SurE [Acidimicrobiales bacterium]
MKILVTNDDGVAATGLHVLARTLVDAGYDIVVAAPDGERSGASAALGHMRLDQALPVTAVDVEGLEDVPVWAVGGPPGLCVLAGRLGGFGDPPDLIVSGINSGANTGRAVLHSGTVGAALTAANFGASGIAVSLDVASLVFHEAAGRGGAAPATARSITGPTADGDDVTAEVVPGPQTGPDDPLAGALWQTAATVATSFVDWVAGQPKGTVLNVNVPNRPLDELAGVRLGRLAPFGTVRTGVVDEATRDGRGLQLQLRPTGETMPEGSDTALVSEGFVSITPLRGIDLDEAVDVTGALAAVPGGPGAT